MESIEPELPECCNHPIALTEKYELETAHKIYNWLKYKLGNFESIQATPNPDEYIKHVEKHVSDWDTIIDDLEDKPEDLRKFLLGNSLSFYMIYMRNYADQENYV